MRPRFTIGIIASILHARAAPPNVVRSTHPEEHLVNNYRRDNDGFNNQEEVLAPLKLAGVSSTQQASFDSLEYTPEVALESVGNGDAGWFDPRLHGGRMLDFATPNLGEPLNVIISAQSDPFVLTSSGFHAYVKSIGFSEECLGLHLGSLQQANLGDGNGPTNEIFLARQYYFPVWGTCWESVAGSLRMRFVFVLHLLTRRLIIFFSGCRRESLPRLEAERHPC